MTIKYYDLGRITLEYSKAGACGITEVEDGGYVKREDYELLEKIVAEYDAWIHFHATGGDYDDFLRARLKHE